MSASSTDKNHLAESMGWRGFWRLVWKIFSILGAGVVLGLIANALSSLLFISPKSIPSDSLFSQLLIHWPIVLLIVACLFLVAGLARVLSREPISLTPISPTKQNREQMLQQLERNYRELSKPPLQGIDWLELGLADRPEAVQNITNIVQIQVSHPHQTPPIGYSIIQAYEQAAHKLLILGEPGAGKSMLLYQLGAHLVEQAKQNETLQLPVLLPLSSWAVKRPSLQQWICDQLCSPLYGVSQQICQQWVQNEQILPLLDGLDEMEESARAACITAINTYHREHLTPLVVCSRQSEYNIAARQQKLTLQNAVVIRPLTDTQINAYFIHVGKPLAALRRALRKNSALLELAKTPLMLNILTLTYYGTSVYGLSHKASLLYRQVWDNYVQRMLDQKKNTRYYSPEQIRSWLCWLAQQMLAHDQSIFYLEQLQTDWLPARGSHAYQWTIRLVSGVLGLLCGTLLNLAIGGLFNGLLGGLVWTPAFILFFGRNNRIEPAETVVWSQDGARGGLVVGLACGVAVKLVFGFLFRDLNPIAFFSITPAFMLFGILALGISGKQLVARDRLIPNEGIRRSITIGLVKGLSIGLIIGLISGMIVGALDGLELGLFSVLFWGLHSGLLIVMRHFILRFWLWKTQVFPWNAPRFLEDARARILLQRIGGGYSSTHSLLLDYFANLDKRPAPNPIPALTSSTNI